MDPETAVRTNEGLCHWAVRRFLGWGDKHPAYEDALQVCRVVLWKSSRAFRPDTISVRTGRPVTFATYARRGMSGALKTFATRDGRNGFLRRGKRKGEVPVGEPATLASLDTVRPFGRGRDALPGREACPAEVAARECRTASVRMAVDALPGRISHVVRGCLLDGRNAKVVGSEVGLSWHEALVRLHVGKTMLRERLAEVG